MNLLSSLDQLSFPLSFSGIIFFIYKNTFFFFFFRLNVVLISKFSARCS